MPTPSIPIEDLLGENQPVMSPTVPHEQVDAVFDRMQGEGEGDLNLAFESLEGLSPLEELMRRFRESAGAFQDAVPGMVMGNLVNAFYAGTIDQAQLISSLMDQFSMDYDEAEDYFLSQIAGGTEGENPLDESNPFLDALDLMGLSGGGGGGGRSSGGGTARQYVGPDQGLVEDYVKGRLVNLVGRADDGRVAMLTDLFLSENRKQFDGAEVDPKQSITEKIRSFEDYGRIHKNRTDANDEDTWISGQMSALMDAGVNAKEAEGLAINFAQAGVSQKRAGELSEFRRVGQGSNQAVPGFFNKMKYAMTVASRSVR